MKNLKNTYKLLLFFSLIAVVSCDDNEDYSDILTKGTTTQENTIFMVTANVYEAVSMVGLGKSTEIVAGINNVMTTDTSVEFTVLKNGSIAELNVDYEMDDALIENETFEGATSIVFLKSGLYDVSVKASSATSLKVVNNRLLYFVPKNVTIRINWENDFYDYGLIMFDKMAPIKDIYVNGYPAVLTVLGYSDKATNVEEISLLPPLGDSYIYLEDYYNDNADIPVLFSLEQEGEPALTGDIIMDKDKWVIKITTEFDGVDKMSYKIEVL